MEHSAAPADLEGWYARIREPTRHGACTILTGICSLFGYDSYYTLTFFARLSDENVLGKEDPRMDSLFRLHLCIQNGKFSNINTTTVPGILHF